MNCLYIAAVLILYLNGDLFLGLYILWCINDSFCCKLPLSSAWYFYIPESFPPP